MNRRILLLAGAVLCTACDVTDPDAPSFSFSITRIATMDYNQPKLVVKGSDDSILVEGQTWSACANGVLAGSLVRPNEQGLALVITDVQETDACAGAVAPYDYKAVLGDLEPGRYHLQILLRHSRGLTPPRTIFHDFVQVR